MMELLMIGLGGSLGSLARYMLGKYISEKRDWIFPMGTFLINLSGALLLGILLGAKVPQGVLFFFGEGFLGAYTTFSTFSYEGIKLMEEGLYGKAAFYILSSVVIGIASFGAGYQGALAWFGR